ncbi:MAG TPA: GNAT family N-acetyltransferase, partial [Vicinamibacterales bacterium]|nr:GNAT family N-acetyltransferase [Vicinamibacterales bacterium]
MLCAEGITLRQLRVSDAASLHQLLTTAEVSRFISPPPTTVEGFERFIAWTHREREAGTYVCFAVVPQGSDTAVGIFQIRALGPTFETAEWGFALGQAHWGS